MVVIIGSTSTFATDWTWTGAAADGNWDTAGNWSLNTVPGLDPGMDNAAIINGSAVAVDRLGITGGGTLELSGGASLSVGAGGLFAGYGSGSNPSYININNSQLSTVSGVNVVAGSIINVNNGGTLMIGGAFAVDSTSSVIVSSRGVLSTQGNFVLSASDNLILDGGNFVTTGEFKPIVGDFTVGMGSSITANLISFEGTSYMINLAGGTLNLLGSGFNGVYGTGGINFTSDTGGVLSVVNLNGLITDGKIYFNGDKLLTEQDFLDNGFIINGNTLSYTVMIPEPSTIALLVFGGVFVFGVVYGKRSVLKK